MSESIIQYLQGTLAYYEGREIPETGSAGPVKAESELPETLPDPAFPPVERPSGTLSINEAVVQILREAAPAALPLRKILQGVEALGDGAPVPGQAYKQIQLLSDLLRKGKVDGVERVSRGGPGVSSTYRWRGGSPAAPLEDLAAQVAVPPTREDREPEVGAGLKPAPMIRGRGDMALTMTRQECPKCGRALMRESQADHSYDLMCLACGWRQVGSMAPRGMGMEEAVHA